MPTNEQLEKAREWLRDTLNFLPWETAMKQHARTLLAATEPVTGDLGEAVERAFYRALGQEPQEDPRDKRIAELEALCHEPMRCAKCETAITGQDILTLNALEAFKDSQILKGERDEARADVTWLTESKDEAVAKVAFFGAEVERLKARAREDVEAIAEEYRKGHTDTLKVILRQIGEQDVKLAGMRAAIRQVIAEREKGDTDGA